jgi:hypothetical protein
MLSKSSLTLHQDTINALGISAAQLENINAKFHKFFRYWLRGSRSVMQSRLGSHYVGPLLYECVSNPIALAIFVDNADYFQSQVFTEKAEVPSAKLYEYCLFACAVGAQAIGTALMDRLDIKLTELEQEPKNEILILLGASGHKEWLHKVLLELGEKQIPDVCYKFRGISDKALHQLSQSMQHAATSAASSSTQPHP